MSLKNWAEHGWLKRHKTTRKEIENLREIVRRDSADARVDGLSPDSRFGIAYNAALKLCTIALYSSGYRAGGGRAHYHTIEALPEILGREARSDADYLAACLLKRNQADYDFVGGVTERDVKELLGFLPEFEKKISTWLEKHHPELA